MVCSSWLTNTQYIDFRMAFYFQLEICYWFSVIRKVFTFPAQAQRKVFFSIATIDTVLSLETLSNGWKCVSRGNELNKYDAENLSHALLHMPGLESLDLSGNPIEDSGIRFVLQVLAFVILEKTNSSYIFHLYGFREVQKLDILLQKESGFSFS